MWKFPKKLFPHVKESEKVTYKLSRKVGQNNMIAGIKRIENVQRLYNTIKECNKQQELKVPEDSRQCMIDLQDSY